MPEIAEVETLRRQIGSHLPLAISEVTVTGKRTVRAHNPADLQNLVGVQLDDVHRRGKWLALSGGDVGVRIHLRMSGRVHLVAAGQPLESHTHVVLGVGNLELRFVDPRTFGEMALWRPGDELGSAALDALDDDLGTEVFLAVFDKTTSPVKALLLDQRRVVQGLGNIYADEVCHRAGVDPRTAACELGYERTLRIVQAVRPVVAAAVEDRGTALADEGWKDLYGAVGAHAQNLHVHARKGCASCGAATSKAKVAGRSTYWCPVCQG